MGKKFQTFQTPTPEWCSVKTDNRFRFVYHLKRRRLPHKGNIQKLRSGFFASINQSINIYFRIFTSILLTCLCLITVNDPRTDIGKPVFMTDLIIYWHRL